MNKGVTNQPDLIPFIVLKKLPNLFTGQIPMASIIFSLFPLD